MQRACENVCNMKYSHAIAVRQQLDFHFFIQCMSVIFAYRSLATVVALAISMIMATKYARACLLPLTLFQSGYSSLRSELLLILKFLQKCFENFAYVWVQLDFFQYEQKRSGIFDVHQHFRIKYGISKFHSWSTSSGKYLDRLLVSFERASIFRNRFNLSFPLLLIDCNLLCNHLITVHVCNIFPSPMISLFQHF